MPATLQTPDTYTSVRFGCLAFIGSSSHTSSRFPDLQLKRLIRLLTKLGMQWLWIMLAEYSDRIA